MQVWAHRLIRLKMFVVSPAIWQQTNYRGEEHKEAYTCEGQGYPGGENRYTLHLI